MAEAQNLATLRRAYQVWSDTKGESVDHWFEFLAPEIRFNSLANGTQSIEFTAPKQSAAEVRGYFKGLTEQWQMLHFTVDDMLADGERVVVRCHTAWRNKATGRIFDTAKLDFWSFRDGRAVEFMEYYDTAAAIRAAGG